MFSFELDDEVKSLQDTAKKFAENVIRPAARDCEKDGDVPETILKKFHELGVGMLDCPEKACGMGCPINWNTVVQEELAWGDPAVAIALGGPGQAGAAVIAFGDEDQKEKFLSPFSDPKAHAMRGAVAFYEDEKGQEYWDMKVVAKKKGDKWELNGKKAFVVNAPVASLIVVFAKTDDAPGWGSIKAFAVEKGTAGMKIGEPKKLMGLNAVKIADVTFENCAVPEANLLKGQPDTRAGLIATINRTRPIDAARAVGTMRAAYDYAVKYAHERVAFGKPIGHFQAMAFLLSDMATEVNAARWMAWRAAWAVDNNNAQATAMVAKAVAQANQSALFVTNNAVQTLGGHGFIQDHPVEKWMRDARSMTVLFGQTHIQNMIANRNALGAWK